MNLKVDSEMTVYSTASFLSNPSSVSKALNVMPVSTRMRSSLLSEAIYLPHAYSSECSCSSVGLLYLAGLRVGWSKTPVTLSFMSYLYQ